MALEYCMYPQLVTGLGVAIEKLEGAGQNYYCSYYTTSAVQNIANALGDGFYAENITLQSDLVGVRFQSGSNSSTLVTIPAGTTIPTLRHMRYSNVAVFFTSYRYQNNTASGHTTALCITAIDASNGTVLYSQVARNAYNTSGNPNATIRVLNASSGVKVIAPTSSAAYAIGCLVFYGDFIILYGNTGSDPANTPVPFNYVKNNAIATMEYRGTYIDKSRTVLIPFYLDDDPNADFKGLYVAHSITTSRTQYNFVKDGTLYYTPGSYDNQVDNYVPLIVISDEAMDVTASTDGPHESDPLPPPDPVAVGE